MYEQPGWGFHQPDVQGDFTDASSVAAVSAERRHTDFCVSHLPWRLDVDNIDSVATSTVALGGPWFVDCRVDWMLGHRGSREIRDTPGDFIAMLMVRRGTEVFTQHERCAEIKPGTAALWDSARPAQCFSVSTLDKRTLFLPREALALPLRNVASAGARTIPDSPNLRLLFSWLQVAQRDVVDPTTASTAGLMVMDLVHAAIAQARGESGESRHVLLLSVKNYLGQHLHEPDLTLDEAARACAISRRYLHILFQDSGETPAEHLRRRRLERARRLLSTDANGLPVTQVAQYCGFTSPSSFSRAFRAEFGVSPREYRESVLS